MTDQAARDEELWNLVIQRSVECEALAHKIVSFTAARGIRADSADSLLRVESADNALFKTPEMRLKLFELKKATLTEALRGYQEMALDPTISTAVAPQHPGPAISGTSAVAARWPAQEAYLQHFSGNWPHPIMPNVWASRNFSNRVPTKTSQVFFWQCCHEELLYSRTPLGNAELCNQFDKRCLKLNGAKTTGHKFWLRTNPELLLVLYEAADIKVKVDQKKAISLLGTVWRKRGKEVLVQLADWFKAQQNDVAGTAARQVHTVAGDATLLSAVRHIQSKIPDLKKQEDATDLHCFSSFIMSKDRFQEEYANVRTGANADLNNERGCNPKEG